MKDLQDTLMGLLGSFVFLFLFDYAPHIMISMIGFHIGVQTMRSMRSQR